MIPIKHNHDKYIDNDRVLCMKGFALLKELFQLNALCNMQTEIHPLTRYSAYALVDMAKFDRHIDNKYNCICQICYTLFK